MNVPLALTNGRIYTQDLSNPISSAVAISGNQIIALGNDQEIKSLLGSSGESIDLAGRCVVPGLVDAHVHFQGYSLSLQRIDLNGTKSLDESLERIHNGISNHRNGDWVEGRGWNQNDWDDGKFPSAADLDQIAPRIPIMLRHKSGHAAWVNSRALKLGGIGADTPDPPGGEIQRDETGNPTGILLEDAMNLVARLIPRSSETRLVAAMRNAQDHCLRNGVTGIHDFDGRACFSALQTMRLNHELNLRVVKNIPVARLDYAIGVGLRTGFGDDQLRIGGVKIFADGALGARTAAMIEPYESEPDNRGIEVTEKEEMVSMAKKASSNGLSVTVHAIGDRANHDVLDIFEAIATLDDSGRMSGSRISNSGSSYSLVHGLRHRIEHAQIVHPGDFKRFAELGVIASMQPIHATSDMEMADLYWGARAKYGYAWRTMLDIGAVLVFGSDAPVEPIEPLTSIFAAVTRQRPDGAPGSGGWYPEQRLTMAETINAYTMGPAFASGREDKMGSIGPGKLADLTIFDRDIFSIPHDELLDISVAGTMVDGRMLYRTW
jgi:predicted amidohydrolase YtcJ